VVERILGAASRSGASDTSLRFLMSAIFDYTAAVVAWFCGKS
jgi:hypothetical protein